MDIKEFDVEKIEEKGTQEKAEVVLHMAAFPLAAEARDGFWLHLGEGPGVDLATSETAGVETEADLHSGANLSTNPMVSAAPVDYVCVMTTARLILALKPNLMATPLTRRKLAESESAIGRLDPTDHKGGGSR